MALTFDPRTAQYRGENGRFVSRDRVTSILDGEVEKTKTRLTGIARLATSGRITTSEFQTRMAETLKGEFIRLAMLGSGGRQGLTQSHYGFIGASLRKQYRRLNNMAEAMSKGELTEKQIMARARNYAESSRAAFWASDRRAQQNAGKNQARRLLDPMAQHCPECLRYEQKEWTDIEAIVPIGVGCRCGGRCRCFIQYRAMFEGNILDVVGMSR